MMALYFFIILSSTLQSIMTKLFAQKNDSPLVFNSLKSSSAFLLMLAFTLFNFSFHGPTIIYGLSYGVSLCISMYSGYQALRLGPMALTSMLVSFSVIIPLIWGVVIRNETLSILQFFAIFLLFIAIILINLKKTSSASDDKKLNLRWFIYIFFTFSTNGICSVLQSEHQAKFPALHTKEFMVFAMFVCFTIYFISAIIKISPCEFKKLKGKHYGIISGIGIAISNLLTLRLAGLERASILFPIISAGSILTSLLCGWILFKEKPKVNHVLALIIGIISITLLKLQ